MADDSEELQCFRYEWKEELRKNFSDKTKADRQDDKVNLKKYQVVRGQDQDGIHCFKEEVRQLRDQPDPVGCLSDTSGSSVKFLHMPEEKSTANVNNEIMLLNLPEPATGVVYSDCKIQQKLPSEKLNKRKKSLVDQLIEDIDEITSIPFFDLSLPKEVGIQIFTDLGIRDLCVCAQVSKAWKCLAEDELIWYHVGCKLGYVQKRDCAAINRANWKDFVRDSILEERELNRNWKERICRLSSLEFERGETVVIFL